MCTQNRNNCNCGCQECNSSNTVCYTGPTLNNSQITNNDTITVALQKLDILLESLTTTTTTTV